MPYKHLLAFAAVCSPIAAQTLDFETTVQTLDIAPTAVSRLQLGDLFGDGTRDLLFADGPAPFAGSTTNRLRIAVGIGRYDYVAVVPNTAQVQDFVVLPHDRQLPFPVLTVEPLGQVSDRWTPDATSLSVDTPFADVGLSDPIGIEGFAPTSTGFGFAGMRDKAGTDHVILTHFLDMPATTRSIGTVLSTNLGDREPAQFFYQDLGPAGVALVVLLNATNSADSEVRSYAIGSSAYATAQGGPDQGFICACQTSQTLLAWVGTNAAGATFAHRILTDSAGVSSAGAGFEVTPAGSPMGQVTGVASADLNSDGVSEVVIGFESGIKIISHQEPRRDQRGDPIDPWFTDFSANTDIDQVFQTGPSLGSAPVIGDVDGDGDLDVVAVYEADGETAVITYRNPDSNLTEITIPSEGTYLAGSWSFTAHASAYEKVEAVVWAMDQSPAAGQVPEFYEASISSKTAIVDANVGSVDLDLVTLPGAGGTPDTYFLLELRGVFPSSPTDLSFQPRRGPSHFFVVSTTDASAFDGSPWVTPGVLAPRGPKVFPPVVRVLKIPPRRRGGGRPKTGL